MKGGSLFRKVAVWGGSLAALVVLLLYLGGSFHEKIEPGAVVEARRETLGDRATYKVQEIVDTEQVEFVGTLRAARRSEVSPKIMATIGSIAVGAGDRVEKGAVLVRLDDRDLQARFEQANQALRAAEATLENAETNYGRFKELLARNSVSKREYDDAERNFRVARAEVERARETVVSAETNLSYSVIEAPIAGVVIEKFVDTGDVATPGRPLLTIYDPSELRLEAAVPEALAFGLSVGEPLRVRLDALNLALDGTIAEIVPQAQTATRSMLVKVAVPGDPRMFEGMFGRLTIPKGERIRYCVADSALRRVGQLRFVDVVDEAGRLERRQVRLGEQGAMGRTEVLSGVTAGERVVLHGPPPPPLPDDKRELLGGTVR